MTACLVTLRSSSSLPQHAVRCWVILKLKTSMGGGSNAINESRIKRAVSVSTWLVCLHISQPRRSDQAEREWTIEGLLFCHSRWDAIINACHEVFDTPAPRGDETMFAGRWFSFSVVALASEKGEQQRLYILPTLQRWISRGRETRLI